MRDWALYKKAVSVHLLMQEIVEPETLDRLLFSFEKFINSHLNCAYCGRILPDESFHRGKTQPNRRGRQSICKTCLPKYRTGKPFKGTECDE